MHVYLLRYHLRISHEHECISLLAPTVGAEQVFSGQFWPAEDEPFAEVHSEDHFYNILIMTAQQIYHEICCFNCFWVSMDIRAYVNGAAISGTFHLSKLKLCTHSVVTHSSLLMLSACQPPF